MERMMNSNGSWGQDEIQNYILDLANSCDTEIIGRRLVDYIPCWQRPIEDQTTDV